MGSDLFFDLDGVLRVSLKSMITEDDLIPAQKGKKRVDWLLSYLLKRHGYEAESMRVRAENTKYELEYYPPFDYLELLVRVKLPQTYVYTKSDKSLFDVVGDGTDHAWLKVRPRYIGSPKNWLMLQRHIVTEAKVRLSWWVKYDDHKTTLYEPLWLAAWDPDEGQIDLEGDSLFWSKIEDEDRRIERIKNPPTPMSDYSEERDALMAEAYGLDLPDPDPWSPW